MFKLKEVHRDLRNLTVGKGTRKTSTVSLLKRKKLFMVDYTFLDKIPLHRDYVFYSPQVLLALASDGTLDLFAILLRTNKKKKSHIVTKETSANKLLFARMHVGVADTIAHQAVNHLGLHFMIEPVDIARKRYLTPYFGENHGINDLLKAHLEGTIFVNWYGRETLLGFNESYFNTLFTIGDDGFTKQVGQFLDFRDLNFPKRMKGKGLDEDESDGIKHFYYRTDGFRLWKMLNKYVKKAVKKVYPSEESFLNDDKIKEFIVSLGDPKRGNIRGWPTSINKTADLVKTLTMVIFAASVQHQVNL